MATSAAPCRRGTRSSAGPRPTEPRPTTHDREAARSAARDRWLEYRDGKGADQEQGVESTRGKDKGRDTPDDDFSL
jgi:hypothetical protein